MRIALAVACLLCSLTAGGQEQEKSALDYIIKSAEQGEATAQFNLGVAYDNGQGVPQDYAEAVRWYRLAAEQGEATAQRNLGSIYYTGQGVPQDYVQAHMWLNLAASRESGASAKLTIERRDRVAGKMTPQQIVEAQRLAREWKAKTWNELKDQ
jgi:TPR repeat protein